MNTPPVEPDALENGYLWDGSGPVDLQVAALERTLRPLRYAPARSVLRWKWMAVAAFAAVAALLLWWPAGVQPVAAWTVAVGPQVRPLHSGQIISTGGGNSARLYSMDLGSLTVEPNSQVRLLRPTGNLERLSLDYGSLRAFIWAPPARFAVKTPSAMAVDLGCVYTLRTDRRGDGELAVELGWVALQTGTRESFIPSGARCRIRKESGPGLPVYDDAPALFRERLLSFEQHPQEDLSEILALARPKDAVTLWHLIPRTRGHQRNLVVGRFAALVELPGSLTSADLLRGQPSAMDAAWDALQLGTAEWWRTWKRDW